MVKADYMGERKPDDKYITENEETPRTGAAPGLHLSALKRATTALRKAPPLLTLDQKKETFFAPQSPLLIELKTTYRLKNNGMSDP